MQPLVRSPRFRGSVPSGAFRFVTLFNLQGTRRFRRNVAIITNHSPLCQELFSSFFSAGHRRLPFSNFFILSRPHWFVKNFFHLFQTYVRPSRDSLINLPHASPLVNTYFSIFRKNSPCSRTDCFSPVYIHI